MSAALAPPVFISGALLSRHYMQEGFLVFRTVGARQDLQSACHLLYQAQTLLAFDAQGMVDFKKPNFNFFFHNLIPLFKASLLTLVLSGGAVKPSLEEMCTLIVGGILTGLWLMLGYLAVNLILKICSIFEVWSACIITRWGTKVDKPQFSSCSSVWVNLLSSHGGFIRWFFFCLKTRHFFVF